MCKLIIGNAGLNCLVDNISETGASVKIPASIRGGIHLGDTVTLKVLLISPVNYLCRVVRIMSDHVGLQFVKNSQVD